MRENMIKKENIKNVLEYILLVLLFFIGLKKGGYYKQDELILVYFIQIILGIYFSLCFRNFKNLIYFIQWYKRSRFCGD